MCSSSPIRLFICWGRQTWATTRLFELDQRDSRQLAWTVQSPKAQGLAEAARPPTLLSATYLFEARLHPVDQVAVQEGILACGQAGASGEATLSFVADSPDKHGLLSDLPRAKRGSMATPEHHSCRSGEKGKFSAASLDAWAINKLFTRRRARLCLVFAR